MLPEILSAFFSDLRTPPSLKVSWEEVYESMIVHTRGASPKKLIGEYRPNEPKAIQKYRLEVYEPITQDAINRGIDSLYRIISESNYHIEYSPTIADYLNETLFTPESYNNTSDSMSFMALMMRYIVRVTIDDPNGALVWMPVNPDGGEPMENPASRQIDVSPVIVNSKYIIHSSEHAFGWEANKNWRYRDSKGNEQSAPYYFLLTTEAIYRIVPVREAQSGDQEDRVYDGVFYKEEFYYNLTDTTGNDAELPRRILGGNSVLNEDGYWYYQSYFNGFVAWGNEAIRSFSDNQAVRVRGNYPVPEEKGQKCASCKGVGYRKSKEEPYDNITCDKCGGHGFTPSRGPFDTYISEPPTGIEGSDAYTSKPAIQWHHPNVDILKESFIVWEKFIDKAERSINIKYPDAAQSGVAKEIDRDKLYDMLIKFSENLFGNIIGGSLDIIEAYRVPSSSTRKGSIINPPNSFDIKSEKDLMAQIKELSDSGAPTPFIANTAKQLAGKVFHGDKIAMKIIDTQAEYDPFFNRPFSELISYQSAGQLSEEDIPRHNHAYQILREIADEKKDAFLSMTFSEITALADEKLKKYIPIRPTTQNVNIGAIIAEANGESVNTA